MTPLGLAVVMVVAEALVAAVAVVMLRGATLKTPLTLKMIRRQFLIPSLLTRSQAIHNIRQVRLQILSLYLWVTAILHLDQFLTLGRLELGRPRLLGWVEHSPYLATLIQVSQGCNAALLELAEILQELPPSQAPAGVCIGQMKYQDFAVAQQVMYGTRLLLAMGLAIGMP